MLVKGSEDKIKNDTENAFYHSVLFQVSIQESVSLKFRRVIYDTGIQFQLFE